MQLNGEDRDLFAGPKRPDITPPASPDPDENQQDGGPITPKIIPFRTLCRCGEEVWIENDGSIYRLRRTRLGKLILTK